MLQDKANCSYSHYYKSKSRSNFFSCCYEILKSVSNNVGTPRWWFELFFLALKPIMFSGIVSLYFNPVLIVYPFFKKETGSEIILISADTDVFKTYSWRLKKIMMSSDNDNASRHHNQMSSHVGFTSSWRRLIYNVLKTSVKRRL